MCLHAYAQERWCAQFVTEAAATLARRNGGKPDDVWLKSHMYPDYYLNTFHYQVSLHRPHHICKHT